MSFITSSYRIKPLEILFGSQMSNVFPVKVHHFNSRRGNNSTTNSEDLGIRYFIKRQLRISSLRVRITACIERYKHYLFL